jgi:hypothetical protein
MDELEFERLEQRLRRAVVGHRPAAPEALLSFIDAVPAGAPARERFGWLRERPGARRGILAVGAAAAMVVALAGSALLMSYRASQPNAGGGSDWSWQSAYRTGLVWPYPFQVPGGFIGTCRNQGQSETLCGSVDGVHWSIPADPAIVSVEDVGLFLPAFLVSHGGIYLAESLPQPVSADAFAPPSGATESTAVLWRSTDGVHWSRLNPPEFGGLTVAGLAAVQGGFVVAGVNRAQETGWALTSTDGLKWFRASSLPVLPDVAGHGGPVGFVIGGRASSFSTGYETWRTLDGTNWTKLSLPAEVNQLGVAFALGNVYAVPRGGYLGTSTTGSGILRSDDGLTWRLDDASLKGPVGALCRIGDRLVAVGLTHQHPFPIWQSFDWGDTWEPVLGPDGRQMKGSWLFSFGDKLGIVEPGLGPELVWVGTPIGASAPSTPSPTLAPSDDACGPTPLGELAVVPDLYGLSGWSTSLTYWGGQGGGCSNSLNPVRSEYAVVGVCHGTGTVHVAILDRTLDETVAVTLEERTMAAFDMVCPLGSAAAPQSLLLVTDATLQSGHVVGILVTGEADVDYSLLLQTRDPAVPSASASR